MARDANVLFVELQSVPAVRSQRRVVEEDRPPGAVQITFAHRQQNHGIDPAQNGLRRPAFDGDAQLRDERLLWLEVEHE
ncbi:MAG: hypothetical protein ACREIA_19685 [Opitutaceae bacterium]